jgi:hypothetical protein
MATRKAEHMPEGMIAFESRFDALGQTYAPMAGADPDADQRAKFRRFVLDHLTGTESGVSDLDTLFAQRIYRERDWIARSSSRRVAIS